MYSSITSMLPFQGSSKSCLTIFLASAIRDPFTRLRWRSPTAERTPATRPASRRETLRPVRPRLRLRNGVRPTLQHRVAPGLGPRPDRGGGGLAQVRPRLAEAAAASLDEIQAALLDAALAAREHWITTTCPECQRKQRIEVWIPDVRSRVAAIELLLREGLGRPPQADETAIPRLPRSPQVIEEGFSWEDVRHRSSRPTSPARLQPSPRTVGRRRYAVRYARALDEVTAA